MDIFWESNTWVVDLEIITAQGIMYPHDSKSPTSDSITIPYRNNNTIYARESWFELWLSKWWVYFENYWEKIINQWTSKEYPSVCMPQYNEKEISVSQGKGI